MLLMVANWIGPDYSISVNAGSGHSTALWFCDCQHKSLKCSIDDDNLLIFVKVGGAYMVRRGEGSWCHAEIIQKRMNDEAKEMEYYVHYENHNRRLDEWVLKVN